jgi:hypothetical protein
MPTSQDPHSGPGAAQFNLGLPKCSLDNGQGHQHVQRSLDLGKALLIMRSASTLATAPDHTDPQRAQPCTA